MCWWNKKLIFHDCNVYWLTCIFFFIVVVVFGLFACLFFNLPLTFVKASDMVSTSRILVAVVQMCYEAKDWDALNENIMLLTKRRSQLKQVTYLFCLDSCFLSILS